MPELTWSDTPCKNGHIGWRRITTGTSRGKTYRHSKCEQCRKDNRAKHRPKDLGAGLRSCINGVLNARLAGAVARKTTKAETLLGISMAEYIIYLERQFQPGWTWQNRGQIWQIDHIKACHTFDLTKNDDVLRCFHYTNTRPLLRQENEWAGNRQRSEPQARQIGV